MNNLSKGLGLILLIVVGSGLASPATRRYVFKNVPNTWTAEQTFNAGIVAGSINLANAAVTTDTSNVFDNFNDYRGDSNYNPIRLLGTDTDPFAGSSPYLSFKPQGAADGGAGVSSTDGGNLRIWSTVSPFTGIEIKTGAASGAGTRHVLVEDGDLAVEDDPRHVLVEDGDLAVEDDQLIRLEGLSGDTDITRDTDLSEVNVTIDGSIGTRTGANHWRPPTCPTDLNGVPFGGVCTQISSGKILYRGILEAIP